MSAYVLVLIFLNGYGISMTTIDYNSYEACSQAGIKYLKETPGILSNAKFVCLERH